MGIFGPPISYLRSWFPSGPGGGLVMRQVVMHRELGSGGLAGRSPRGSGHQCLEKTGHVSLVMWAKAAQMAPPGARRQ